MKKILHILLCAFIISTSYAQQQANHWYFGTLCGLNFTSGSPVAVTNSPVNTNEGTASISDAAGNLQFYTDGMLVWDKTNTQMPNGFGLLGDVSTTQSVIIIPDPASATLFYIFTLKEEVGDLNYSVVDLSLNGGNGDVTIKNSFLRGNMTEKLNAVNHCNNQDVWVTAHDYNNNNFVSYLVSASGISSPVISSLGAVHTDVHGQMKFSTDGNKIACAIGYQDIVEYFDFDKNTGIISNPATLAMPPSYHAYGIEFSPDSKRLYCTYYQTGSFSETCQYDLTASNVSLSKVTIATDPDPIMYSLQLGPDHKIYATKEITPFLSVINSPNALGLACNFVPNAVNLDPLGMGSMCMLGLPNFNQSYFNLAFPNVPCSYVNANFQISNSIICANTCIDFTDQSTGTISNWQWNFQGASIASSTLQNVSTVCYTTPGTYNVTLIISNGSSTDTLTQTVTVLPNPIANAGPDVTLTAGDSTTLNASGGISFVWSPLSNLSCTACQSPIAWPTQSTVYIVTVTDTNGCFTSDDVLVTVSTPEIVCGEAFVPTAFSPNGDQSNDILYVMGDCIVTFEFVVFDRWGEKVFTTTDLSKGWDGKYHGKELDAAVFAYYLKGTLQNGTDILLKGNITLMK